MISSFLEAVKHDGSITVRLSITEMMFMRAHNSHNCSLYGSPNYSGFIQVNHIISTNDVENLGVCPWGSLEPAQGVDKP